LAQSGHCPAHVLSIGPMMDASSFAAMISGLEAHGISRPEIVRRSGLSKNTIWRAASGELRNPTERTVERMQQLCKKVEGRT